MKGIVRSLNGPVFGAAILMVAVSLASFGASPIANVSSSESFKVSGVSVPVAGIRSWPVVDGDELRAGNAPVTLTFKDGTRVVLGKNSRATVEGKNKNAALRLLDGAMAYTLRGRSAVRLYSDGNLISAEPGIQGTAAAGTARDADAAALIGSKSGAGTAADCCTTPPVISRRR